MPIRYKSDIDWFEIVYLKTDLEQNPWTLVGVLLSPNGPMFTISREGETIDVYEGEFTREVNKELRLGIKNDFD